MSTAQDIRGALGPVLAPLGLVVEAVSVSPAGKRRVVRVLVDSDITGLDDADTSSVVPPAPVRWLTQSTHDSWLLHAILYPC